MATAGPNVARSATGAQLAQGPKGDKGDPGTPGPQGAQGNPGSGVGGLPRVNVSHGTSPFAALDNTRHIVDVASGGATIQLQVGKAASVQVAIKIICSTGVVSSTNKLTILAPAGGTVEQPLDNAGTPTTPGTYGPSAVYQLSGDLGVPMTLECDGANNWGYV